MGIDEFIDSHAHLNDKTFSQDIEQTIERAHKAGVAKIIVPGDSIETSVDSFILSATNDDIYAAAGVHPNEAKNLSNDAIGQFHNLVTEPKVVAIGEIGLDYHYDHSPHDVQQECFRKFLDIAVKVKKPVIIHCREAYWDLISILKENKYAGLEGVCHCFSGTGEDAVEILNLGFYISFAGPITFPKSDNLRKIASEVPLDKMLLETDSPYLAPQPVRGKRNEPAFIVYNAEKIAFLHHKNIEDVKSKTADNAIRLFRLNGQPEKSTLTYNIGNNLYVNLTSNCTNDCVFCQRKRKPSIQEYNLYLPRDPDSEAIIKDIKDPSKYEEVVFCGFGEPLLRLDVIKQVALWLKKNNVKRIRIDTNGQGNLIYKRNIVPELKGIIDAFSISLNACNAKDYQRLCNSYFGEKSYEAVKDFIRECRKHFKDVTVSIVGVEGISTEESRKIIENELGCKFRIRNFKKEL